ncbi:hypothetical protein GUITHDRAFT_156117 [Guillardia theta CCMP2712]|uniref:Uncharacterized protein n=1 Tax=Guillardia theta (strain CCMP2712) TaxID=905079 RepID=L1IBL6_GUITC|nr:hypothetical protein GUITHDRAFT_156117 [Guillardia theta CCMP2712]EKX33235.1 hypothetical protein GUITHDRAFT_156117 [Guillardia theta CCMP2712]|eukprot:XP_005820215.1 hypothetical protein GUITHDRAFT_156117 [Guillardia theta CCMP2712]
MATPVDLKDFEKFWGFSLSPRPSSQSHQLSNCEDSSLDRTRSRPPVLIDTECVWLAAEQDHRLMTVITELNQLDGRSSLSKQPASPSRSSPSHARRHGVHINSHTPRPSAIKRRDVGVRKTRAFKPERVCTNPLPSKQIEHRMSPRARALSGPAGSNSKDLLELHRICRQASLEGAIKFCM